MKRFWLVGLLVLFVGAAVAYAAQTVPGVTSQPRSANEEKALKLRSDLRKGGITHLRGCESYIDVSTGDEYAFEPGATYATGYGSPRSFGRTRKAGRAGVARALADANRIVKRYIFVEGTGYQMKRTVTFNEVVPHAKVDGSKRSEGYTMVEVNFAVHDGELELPTSLSMTFDGDTGELLSLLHIDRDVEVDRIPKLTRDQAVQRAALVVSADEQSGRVANLNIAIDAEGQQHLAWTVEFQGEDGSVSDSAVVDAHTGVVISQTW